MDDPDTFTHLLVPLDGSQLAESALPPAAFFAEMYRAKVTLMHVIEKKPPQEVHGERHLSDPQAAEEYLESVASRAFPEDISVSIHVHMGGDRGVAQTITEHITEMGIDLVVMCTHGRGGVRKFLFGSIAQQVIGLGSKPVLLIQPRKSVKGKEFSCHRLLAPLDGDPVHEQALDLAAELSRKCQASIYLETVVPTSRTLPGEKAATAILLPGSTSAMLDLNEQYAEQYLQALEKKMSRQGITVSSDVGRGDPAEVIVETARRIGADLVVMATHGRSGTKAFWAGSVAPKISNRSHLPLLLIPVVIDRDSEG